MYIRYKIADNPAMRRASPPPELHQLQQQYKRQNSYGVAEMGQDSAHSNSSSNSNNNMANELQTLGMRIRQRVDQGYSLAKPGNNPGLSNASLNPQDNVKNYAALIVPQFNPTSPPLTAHNNNGTFESFDSTNDCVNSTPSETTTNNSLNHSTNSRSIDTQNSNNGIDINTSIDTNEQVIYSNGKRRY